MIGSLSLSGKIRDRRRAASAGRDDKWSMKVPLPLLFLLLMVLVIFSVYDILNESYVVHKEANRRVAKAVLEATLTRAHTGLNDIASRVARTGAPLDSRLPDVVLQEDTAHVKDLAGRTLFLTFDRDRHAVRGRVGYSALGPAVLRRLAAQPAFPRLFNAPAPAGRLPDAQLVMVDDVPFILSDPQPLKPDARSGGAAYLVVGLPAGAMVFDELQKYEVFSSGALREYLKDKNDLSGLAHLIVTLQNREYAKFHFNAVAQIVVLLIAFIIAVMIGRHVDEKNDALQQSRDIIADREREAQHLRQLAEAANEAKSQFIHNMSHELRTPLNAILGCAEVITAEAFGRLEGPQVRYKEYAGSIHAGGVRLLNSVSQVLEYAALIDADGELCEENIDLTALLADLSADFEPQLEERNVTLDIADAPVLPALRADRGMARSLFRQVIANAVDYSDAGGSVIVSPGFAADGGLRIAIRDHGRGMTQAQQNQVFDPFFQAEDALAREHQGMGLGLSLARTYAQYHGADIKIRSAPGDGTTVTVLFPANRSVTDVPAAPPVVPKAA